MAAALCYRATARIEPSAFGEDLVRLVLDTCANQARKSRALCDADSMHSNILTRDDDIRALLERTKRIAVLGIKTEAQADQPSFSVPKYLVDVGFEVIPVPVYYPEVTMILGRPVFRSLMAIEGEVDLVDVFRKSSDVRKHLADLLAKKPHAVWLQLGIRDDSVAEELAASGIKVVQDKCILVEHRRLC